MYSYNYKEYKSLLKVPLFDHFDNFITYSEFINTI